MLFIPKFLEDRVMSYLFPPDQFLVGAGDSSWDESTLASEGVAVPGPTRSLSLNLPVVDRLLGTAVGHHQ